MAYFCLFFTGIEGRALREAGALSPLSRVRGIHMCIEACGSLMGLCKPRERGVAGGTVISAVPAVSCGAPSRIAGYGWNALGVIFVVCSKL